MPSYGPCPAKVASNGDRTLPARTGRGRGGPRTPRWGRDSTGTKCRPRGHRPARPLGGSATARRRRPSSSPLRPRPASTSLAITDHDTVGGWAEAADAARVHGVTLVRGIEISCAVAALLDPPARLPPRPRRRRRCSAELARARDSRSTRGSSGWSRCMAADGIPLGYDEVLAAGRARRHRRAPAHRRRPHRRTARSATATRRSARGSATTRPTTSATTRPTPCGPSSSCAPPAACRSSPTPSRGPGGRSSTTRSSTDGARPGSPGSRPTTATTARGRAPRSTRARRALGLLVTGSSDYHGEGKRTGSASTPRPRGARGDRGAWRAGATVVAGRELSTSRCSPRPSSRCSSSSTRPAPSRSSWRSPAR